ncbi:uncharacterized protein LOC121047902 [Ixodes scapularis]|uniref:uncharacterized protein LOC121047902 n=1 Tax=Ixodes scapularis TaxID=6945 RepID=UPI001AD72EAF|nr:uncharacterized protein LOC121047902 [Ixodes scapularis]
MSSITDQPAQECSAGLTTGNRYNICINFGKTYLWNLHVSSVADPRAAGHAPFTDVGGGRFHLKSGITIGSHQAKKALGQRKPALMAKDIAQALWGRQGLADRTYGGKLAPKDYHKPDAILRKEMTPEKVALVIETVTHWGTRAGVPVADAIDNISTILSRKIQDVRKSLKRQNM